MSRQFRFYHKAVMAVNPTEVLTVQLVFFKVSGLWRLENQFYWPHTFYAAIFQIIFLVCYTGFKCANFLCLTDVNSIIRELYICCSELSLVVKVINFLYNQSEMKNFLVEVKSFKLLSVSEEELMIKRLGKFTKILIFQLICAEIAIVFSCGAPFFANEPVLPYPAWYPLDWYNDRTSYWIVYCYQVAGILYEANAVVLLELFVIYLMIVTGAHLDILAMRLTKLGVTTDATNGKSVVGQDSSHNDLVDCIEVHRKILKFQTSIEQSFSVPYFIQFIISGIILCIASFQIAIIKPADDIVNLIFYLSFTMVIGLEIFLPCYFGTENIFKSNYLTTAVYSSNWMTMSVSSKKTIAIFMDGLMKPKILRSGKIFSLTMSTFLGICNRTYSLFAVLKTIMK